MEIFVWVGFLQLNASEKTILYSLEREEKHHYK